MRKANDKNLKCSLRKPCEKCGKSYGRKLRPGSKSGRPYLEAVANWKSSRFCSNRCRNRAEAVRQAGIAAEKKRQGKITAKILPYVFDSFLFGRAVSNPVLAMIEEAHSGES